MDALIEIKKIVDNFYLHAVDALIEIKKKRG